MLAEAERPTPLNSTIKDLVAQDGETQMKFFAMEHVFWIKVRRSPPCLSFIPSRLFMNSNKP